MTRQICPVLGFLALLALLVGCSGNGDMSPVEPATTEPPPGLTGASEPSPERDKGGGHTLWGLWQGALDAETGKLDIASIRAAAFHVNVTGQLQPPKPPGLSVSINSINPSQGLIDLDLTIKHPFPNTNLRGFDVRGIVMGSGATFTAKSDPTLVFFAPGGTRLTNADGYSRWWNAQEFTSPGFFGFVEGKLGKKGFVPATTLNPYKYFADPLVPTDPVVPKVNLANRGTFSTDMTPPELTRNYVLKFPVLGGLPDWRFQYAIDASWAPPTGSSPKPKPIEDFPIEANCPETFHIQVDTTGTTAWYVDGSNNGGSLVLWIEVFDWQASGNPDGINGEIQAIRIESATLFDTVITVPLSSLPGSQPISGIYEANVPYVHPTGQRDQEVLITVLSSSPVSYEPPISGPVYPEDAGLAAFALVNIPIANQPPLEIEVEIPNGGENWQAGTDQTIEWSWTGDIPEVDIFLSTDGGTTYPVTLVESLTNDGDWLWEDIPDFYVTTSARIKLASATEPDVWDESDEDFSITPALKSITVTNPNGGEFWGIGSSQAVEWNWAGDIPAVNIDLSLDGGHTYDIPLAEDLPNTGDFQVDEVGNWPTEEAKVRVSDASDPGVLDESDENFTIEETGQPITVLVPNGGEIWLALTSEEVSWTASAGIEDVKIELSLDSGASYTVVIAESTPNDGSYLWDPIMPDCVGDFNRVKISDVTDPLTFDESDEDFMILANPYLLHVDVPNGGEVWEAGTQEEIEWTSIGPVGPFVKLEYVIGWGTPQLIVDSTENDGSFIWDPVPDEDSNEVKVMVTSVQFPFITDDSDEFFTIVPAPQPIITVDVPNGSEEWEIDTSEEIQWHSEDLTGQVKIEYTLQDGGIPQLIIDATDDDGAFLWDPIPGPPTETARVIVSSIDMPAVSDQSDDLFTIYEPKMLELTSPNGGETLEGGGTWDILWNYDGAISTVMLELSLDGGSTFPLAITDSTECDGVYEWDPIPLVNTDEAIVRISDVDEPSVNDVSDAVFTIETVGDTITVTQPNGGEVLQWGSQYEIRWLWTGGIMNVKIDLSTDSGGTYDVEIIDLTECDGSFVWDPVPEIDTTTARIRVADADAPATFDESDEDFEISEAKLLELTSPNGGETLEGGGAWDILWNYDGAISAVMLELSLDGGSTFPETITDSTECDGVYEWDPIPPVNTDLAIVRVSDVDEPSVNDVSDAVFTIETVSDTITVTQPNGGEVLLGGSQYEITWLWTGGITNVKIDLSTDSGGTYDVEVTALTECDGSFMWDPVPDLDTTTARIRVADADAPATLDESDEDFEITTVTPPGWNPIPGLTGLALSDPVPDQGSEPEDLMVYSVGTNQSRGEINDGQDNNKFWQYIDSYTATTGAFWEYATFASPLHKFDVLLDGSFVFVSNSNTDSFPNEQVNDLMHCAYTANDNVTGDTSDGYWHLYGDTGDPDPDELPWRRTIDFSCGVPGGLDDTNSYHLVTYSMHPDNPQPHPGNIIVGAWDTPYDPDSLEFWLINSSIQGGGEGPVDDTDPGSMAFAVDDDTNLSISGNPAVGLWVLDSEPKAVCHALAFDTGDLVIPDNYLDSEECGTSTAVDVTVAPAKAFGYEVTDPGFNWLVALLDNGDGTWSVGVWEFDYLADPVEFVEIDITDPLSGTPMAVDVDGADFEIHVLADNGGTVEATVFAYTP